MLWNMEEQVNTDKLIEQATMGGPGLDGYAYNAELLCIECGRKAIEEAAPAMAAIIASTDDPEFRDSEHFPQPVFFGESDVAEHCAVCGEYLYGGEIEDSK